MFRSEKILLVGVACLIFASCANTIKTETLDYYKVALESVDAAVREGMRYHIETMPNECFKSDTCVDMALSRWYQANYAIKAASKYLQLAYMLPRDPDGTRALACAVVRLHEVNTILWQNNVPMSKDYVEFFKFIVKSAQGQMCSPADQSEKVGE